MISSKWLQFCKTEEERDSTRTIVQNSTLVLGILQQILERQLEELQASRMEEYEIANWPYYQADKLGQIRQLKKVIDLLKL